MMNGFFERVSRAGLSALVASALILPAAASGQVRATERMHPVGQALPAGQIPAGQVAPAGQVPAASGMHLPVQRALVRNTPPGPHGPKVKIGPHTRFGTIITLQANSFVMQTRARGRSLTVDDTIPLQTGTYSFPLFVGKLVMVTGDIDANGIMHADTITRVPLLDPHTPGDH